MKFYPFHFDDYQGATAHLSNEQDLTYRRLLDWYYNTGGPVPVDGLEALARRLRVAVDDLEVVLADFFACGPDGWRQPRCDAELARYATRYEAQANGGKKTAAKRWGPGSKNPDPDSSAIAKQTPSGRIATENQNQNQNQNQKEDIGPKGPRRQQAADKPAGDRKQSSKPGLARKPAPPVSAIVQAYHDALPMLPRVVRPSANNRPRAIARLWAFALERRANGDPEQAAARALGWVRDYFARCAADGFITGRDAPGAGHEGWRADFDYVLKDKTITRLIERPAPAARQTTIEAVQ